MRFLRSMWQRWDIRCKNISPVVHYCWLQVATCILLGLCIGGALDPIRILLFWFLAFLYGRFAYNQGEANGSMKMALVLVEMQRNPTLKAEIERAAAACAKQ